MRLRWRRNLRAYLYLCPFLLLFVLFAEYPLLSAIDLSFRKVFFLGAKEASFIGFANYAELLHDPLVAKSLWNTVRFVLMFAIPDVVLGLGLALLLHIPMRCRTLFRTTFFAPVVTSTVATTVVWRYLYQRNFGFFNQILVALGLPRVPWLVYPAFAMPSVALMCLWKSVGYNMVIFLAGLQGIPEVFYEAARIDGASSWALFQHITVPLLQRTTLFVTILTMIGSFQVFTQTFILTRGGPMDSTLALVQYIYYVAFQGHGQDLGYASAVAMLLFGIILLLTLVQLWIGKTQWEY